MWYQSNSSYDFFVASTKIRGVFCKFTHLILHYIALRFFNFNILTPLKATILCYHSDINRQTLQPVKPKIIEKKGIINSIEILCYSDAMCVFSIIYGQTKAIKYYAI